MKQSKVAPAVEHTGDGKHPLSRAMAELESIRTEAQRSYNEQMRRIDGIQEILEASVSQSKQQVKRSKNNNTDQRHASPADQRHAPPLGVVTPYDGTAARNTVSSVSVYAPSATSPADRSVDVEPWIPPPRDAHVLYAQNQVKPSTRPVRKKEKVQQPKQTEMSTQPAALLDGQSKPWKFKLAQAVATKQTVKVPTKSLAMAQLNALSGMGSTEEEMKASFTRIDKDGGGTLDKGEIRDALVDLGKTDKEIRHILDTMLREEMNFEEFKEMVKPKDTSWRDRKRVELLKGTKYEKPPFVLNPHTTQKRSWDCWVLMLVLYSSVSTPLQVENRDFIITALMFFPLLCSWSVMING
jgi:hypothetical protein